MARTAETRRDRIALVQEAGLGRISLVSVLAGMLVAYGAFALLAAIAAGILNAVGVDTAAFTTNDWRQLGVGGGILAAAVLLVSYLFGGYVAGRMARRAGAVNGLAVFVFGVLVAIAVGAAVGSQTDTDTVVANLRSLGVPTSGSEYGGIGTVAAIASLLAMLFGSVLGGITGERWHGRLMDRVLDPTVGPEAAAAEESAEAERRRAAMEERRHEREVDLRGDRSSSGADPVVITDGTSRSRPGEEPPAGVARPYGAEAPSRSVDTDRDPARDGQRYRDRRTPGPEGRRTR